MRTVLRLLAAVLYPTIPLAAQDHEHGRGETVGRVVFPVSCNSQAQQRFERAMAILHSFWWEEGTQAFRSVIEADSTCAMGYWGIALNAWGNPLAGGPSGDVLRAAAASAERAAAMNAPTPRERGRSTPEARIPRTRHSWRQRTSGTDWRLSPATKAGRA